MVEVTIERGPFTGLYTYEIVMIVMGVVLFAVAIWALVRAIRADKPFFSHLSIFLVVALLVGFPSVKAVKLGEDLKTVSEAAAGNTGDAATPERKRVVDAAAANVLSRLPTAQARVAVANAYRATGDVDKAYALAADVGKTDTTPEVKRALAPVFAAKLEAAVREVPPAATVSDPAKREAIAAVVRQLDATGIALSPQARVTMAQGLAAIGDDAKAKANLERAQAQQRNVRVDPRLLTRLQIPPHDG